MYYKTYSFTYTKIEIKRILEHQGYIVMSLAKTLDLIPSLRDNKLEIFKDDSRTIDNKYPPAFYDVKFAWKTDDEFLSLSLAIEHMADTWKNLPWRYGSGDFYKSYIFRYKDVKKYIMESVLNDLIKEQVNKITKY